jgi:hypothetical protein
MMSPPQINGGTVAKTCAEEQNFQRLAASARSDIHAVASSRWPADLNAQTCLYCGAGSGREVELDWNKLEEVVERAIRKARSEELKEVAEAIKTLADYMKTGFEAVFKAIEEMRKTFDERLKRLEVTMGYLGGRWGRDLEKMVLELFKEALERRGVEAEKVEKLVLKTDVGVVEVDVHIHDGRGYLIEVKAVAYGDDVGWFAWRAKLAAEELARQGKKVERLILVAVHIDKEALEKARQLGIDVIYGNVID